MLGSIRRQKTQFLLLFLLFTSSKLVTAVTDAVLVATKQTFIVLARRKVLKTSARPPRLDSARIQNDGKDFLLLHLRDK